MIGFWRWFLFHVAGYNGKTATQKYALQNYVKDHLKGIRYFSGYNFVFIVEGYIVNPPYVRWLYIPFFYCLLTHSYIIIHEIRHVNKKKTPSKPSWGLVWMRMYSSQSTCVEVDWSGLKLSSIPFHSNTCGLESIHMHPNKAWGLFRQFLIL